MNRKLGHWLRAAAAGRLRPVASADSPARNALLRRGFALEYLTLGWNMAGIVVLAIAAISARSVALAGFGLDSLIEIGASTVVIWELTGTDAGPSACRSAAHRLGVPRPRGLPARAVGRRAGHGPTRPPPVPGPGGISVDRRDSSRDVHARRRQMARPGRALENPVLLTEARVTLIDGILATAVLVGLVLDYAFGWWWADPLAVTCCVYYAAREARVIFAGH